MRIDQQIKADQEAAARLLLNVNKVPAKDRAFAQSLAEGVVARGIATPKQRYWLDRMQRAAGVRKAPEIGEALAAVGFALCVGCWLAAYAVVNHLPEFA